jgi:hypothetical protein
MVNIVFGNFATFFVFFARIAFVRLRIYGRLPCVRERGVRQPAAETSLTKGMIIPLHGLGFGSIILDMRLISRLLAGRIYRLS